VKIILGGPPHSGKGCLREGLKKAIIEISEGRLYPYVITACPDGEGSWFQEAYNTDNENATKIKQHYKSDFSEEKFKKWAAWVMNCPLPITIVDIGGIPDKGNEIICSQATHAILIAGNPNELPKWRELCSTCNLEIITEIRSDYFGTQDKPLVEGHDKVYRGSVHALERGDLTIKNRPTVKALAKIIIEKSKKG